MEIKRIDKVNVSEQVYSQLLQLILDGTWKAGDRIPSENELAESFGVSRSTLRQSLQKLAAIGLLETRTGDGSYIRELSLGTYLGQLVPAMYLSDGAVAQVMEFRMLVEAEAAALAAGKAGPEDIKALRESYGQMLRYGGDLPRCVEMDANFHRLIMNMSGNMVMVQVHYLLQEVLRQTHTRLISVMGNGSGVEYHPRIIEALERRDEEAARSLMREHLRDTLEKYQQAEAMKGVAAPNNKQ